MKFKSLEVQNFLSISEAKIDLTDRGLLLVQGENKDDPSASSNGAGKSSIVDGLCWALFGVTARDVSGDAVINLAAKKNCMNAVVMIEGDQEFRVVRYRKHATGKNMVTISERNLLTGIGADLTKGTDKETQLVINAIVGCSLEVFQASVYCGQEKMPDLPGMTDKQLKLLIEEAAGVELLADAYQIARTRHNTAKAGLDILTNAAATTASNRVRLDAELASHQAQSKVFEDGRRQRAKDELAKVLPINVKIAESEEALKAWDEPATKAELETCRVKIDSLNAEQLAFDGLLKKHSAADREVTRLKTIAQNAKSSVEAMERKLEGVKNHIGKPCGECGKTYGEHDLAGATKTQQEAIVKARADLRPNLLALKDAIDAATAAADAASTFKGTMTDVTAVATRQRELSNLLNAIEAAKRQVDSHRKDVESIKRFANTKLTEANPWTKAIDSKESEIKFNAIAIADLNTKIAEKTTEVDLLASTVKVFGPAGVRAHILDTVTPFLNERTTDYLGTLADGNIHAVWNTLSTTAKGEVREKFNIEVTNDKGGDSFSGLSGGEKRKVRISAAMALQDLVASRATKPIDLFVADEVDHALDEPGLERLMAVLDKKAKERGTVLVISHNSLADWIPNVITVTKEKGSATVSGAVSPSSTW